MNSLSIKYMSLETLIPAGWNPNKVDPINLEKIANSLKEGVFKPIIVRQLDNGALEIIGGEHRVLAARMIGMPELPVMNLGKLTDAQSRKINLQDNARYGEDDNQKLSEALGMIGSVDEILASLPFDADQLPGFFGEDKDFDIDFDDLDDSGSIDLEPKESPTRSHQIMRFKVATKDAARISDLIKRIQSEQGLTTSDDLTNAGDALVYLINNATESSDV